MTAGSTRDVLTDLKVELLVQLEEGVDEYRLTVGACSPEVTTTSSISSESGSTERCA
jgi:hypothetical protein